MNSSELFEHIMVDDTESRGLFLSDFRNEVEELSDIFSQAFNLLEESPCNNEPSIRASTVSGYIYLAIE